MQSVLGEAISIEDNQVKSLPLLAHFLIFVGERIGYEVWSTGTGDVQPHERHPGVEEWHYALCQCWSEGRVSP